MSGVCERCYFVVHRPCTTSEEYDTCKNLRRSRELALPKVINVDGPLTRLGKANQPKGKR